MSNCAPLVDLHHMAILLDVDGTLLDIPPTPREVFVSPEYAIRLNACPSARRRRICERPTNWCARPNLFALAVASAGLI